MKKAALATAFPNKRAFSMSDQSAFLTLSFTSP
ncbi:hypothetical protein C8D77_102863 [Mesorhizobium loti]|uniref:Uncharacterized protein n=1 Tax=Rhizobium loti TaxID=381 RepID=A0A8E2WHV9_RHILI|nr:hypothetical protein C8D77_102863 [Mesorhizobium loti]